MPSSSLSLIKSLRIVLSIVPSKEKRKFWFLLLISFLSAGIEIVIAGLVALLAAVFASTDLVVNNKYFLTVKKWVGSEFLDDSRILALVVLCLLLLVIVLKNLLAMYQQWKIVDFSESVSMSTREHMFQFYLRAPFLWVVNTGPTELLFNLQTGASVGQSLNHALNIFSNGLLLAGLCVTLLVAAPIPALIFLISIGGLGYLVVKLSRTLMDRYSKRVFEANQGIHSNQQMAVHGLKEMRIYGREVALQDAYIKKLACFRDATKRQLTVSRFPVSGIEILAFLTLVVVICYMIFIQKADMVYVSGIMGFMAAAAWRALPAVNRTIENITLARTHLPYIRNVAKIIILEQEFAPTLMPSLDIKIEPLEFKSQVEFKDVTFRYPRAEKDALQNISFNINKGQMVGLIGVSGSGKSTLVNVLTGLLPSDSGCIQIDGNPLSLDDTVGWLQNIGYVGQSPFIFDATLADNIALSRWGEDIDRTRVLECCRRAVLDFVDDLENGIDTTLGDRGVKLSGGEAQRVAIARALYRNPELIIFDEATSALDLKNEQSIHSTILELQNNITIVIIAHRLSTVTNCDKIIWLEDGKVKKAGSSEMILPEYEESLKQDACLNQTD